ncbi:MAG: SDR family oxidoreductase [Pseudomonadota bacterium]
MAQQDAGALNILITGATDGLGLRLAKFYAERGNFVLATGRQSITDDEAFFGTDRIRYIVADQDNPNAAAETIRLSMTRLGWKSLDLAVLNAATGWSGAPGDEPSATVEKQIAVNLTAPILIARAVAPFLFEAEGQLTLIGSTAHRGAPMFATYAATKAGLHGFARSLAEEWRGRARVQIIHPGPTRTTMHAKAGMKIGMARLFFMGPKRAARAILKSIRSGEKTRTITRAYAWRALFSPSGRGSL